MAAPSRTLRLGTVLLVVAATFLLLSIGIFEPAESRLTAARAELLDRAPTGQVAIVEIDAKSLSELSTWPWSRRYHADALQRLHGAGATVVAFDVDFSARSEARGDRAFAEALRKSQPVILPIFQQRASDRPSDEGVIKSLPAPPFGSALVGGVNIFAGPDGVVRDYPAATMIGGQIRPSMAAMLAENDDFGDRAFHPDWSIDAERIPRFSFVDVLRGRVPASAVSGKRILIGATAIELGDRYTIPRFGTVPGVVVQALAADSLLQGRAITRSGTLPTIAGVVLIAVLLGGAPFRRFNWTFPAAAGAVLLVVAAVPIAIQARWPVSVDSAAMLFCAFACAIARILFEVRGRVRLNALLDAETRLPNLRALEARLVECGEPNLLLAAGSIERFENIRNAIGTEATSELVRRVAGRIEALFGVVAYRIAPDTLAWLQLNQPGSADSTAAFFDLFREPVETAQGPVDVQLTLGMAAHSPSLSPATWVERALSAISSARSAGESRHWYQGADPVGRRELSLMGELRRGMALGEVAVAYQPKLDIRTGKITHAEALVRWRHPVDGLIPPDRFIPLAERTGIIRELTAFVLRRAAGDCARFRDSGRQMVAAVNVSASDIGSASFVDEVSQAIKEAGADPSCLTLEVTESAIISSPETAIAVLTALRRLGIQLAVDDYGTGQSTLSYLKRLPVNELKIDKCFVTAICENENDRIMVRSTIDLAHELGLKVVAEGVEDAATLRLLRALGCDFAQGYFIGQAMPFDELCAIADDPHCVREAA